MSTVRLDSRVARDMMDKMVTVALSRCDGNRRKAAEMLGMSVRSLQRRIAMRVKENR